MSGQRGAARKKIEKVPGKQRKPQKKNFFKKRGTWHGSIDL